MTDHFDGDFWDCEGWSDALDIRGREAEANGFEVPDGVWCAKELEIGGLNSWRAAARDGLGRDGGGESHTSVVEVKHLVAFVKEEVRQSESMSWGGGTSHPRAAWNIDQVRERLACFFGGRTDWRPHVCELHGRRGQAFSPFGSA